MKANYVPKMERSSKGKYIDKEVDRKKTRLEKKKKHHQSWRVEILRAV